VLVYELCDFRPLLSKTLLFFALPPFPVLSLDVLSYHFKVDPDEADDVGYNIVLRVFRQGQAQQRPKSLTFEM
jgi:hypothetical protein